MPIDWKLVNERLMCPICGDKACIEPETDGTMGFHTHRFTISREEAERISQPTNPKPVVFVGINNYASGEYLFVARSLETAIYSMKERYGRNCVVEWNATDERYDVRRSHTDRVVAYIRKEPL